MKDYALPSGAGNTGGTSGEYNHFGSTFESDPQHHLMASLALSVTEHALQGEGREACVLIPCSLRFPVPVYWRAVLSRYLPLLSL